MRASVRLEVKDEHGTPLRDHLAEKARRGDLDAARALEIPPCPEEMEFYVQTSYDLYGRSGIGLGGVAPLSHVEIAEWARLTRVDLRPYDVHALKTLDAVLREPAVGVEEEQEKNIVHWPEIPQWKVRPAGVEPQFTRQV